MSTSVDLSRIQADALAIRPARVLAWVWSTPFIILGFIARVLWIAVALALASAHAGWLAATKRIEQAQATPARTPGGGP